MAEENDRSCSRTRNSLQGTTEAGTSTPASGIQVKEKRITFAAKPVYSEATQEPLVSPQETETVDLSAPRSNESFASQGTLKRPKVSGVGRTRPLMNNSFLIDSRLLDHNIRRRHRKEPKKTSPPRVESPPSNDSSTQLDWSSILESITGNAISAVSKIHEFYFSVKKKHLLLLILSYLLMTQIALLLAHWRVLSSLIEVQTKLNSNHLQIAGHLTQQVEGMKTTIKQRNFSEVARTNESIDEIGAQNVTELDVLHFELRGMEDALRQSLLVLHYCIDFPRSVEDLAFLVGEYVSFEERVRALAQKEQRRLGILARRRQHQLHRQLEQEYYREMYGSFDECDEFAACSQQSLLSDFSFSDSQTASTQKYTMISSWMRFFYGDKVRSTSLIGRAAPRPEAAFLEDREWYGSVAPFSVPNPHYEMVQMLSEQLAFAFDSNNVKVTPAAGKFLPLSISTLSPTWSRIAVIPVLLLLLVVAYYLD